MFTYPIALAESGKRMYSTATNIYLRNATSKSLGTFNGPLRGSAREEKLVYFRLWKSTLYIRRELKFGMYFEIIKLLLVLLPMPALKVRIASRWQYSRKIKINCTISGKQL